MKGDEIPAGARILAVVDYFDALTSERPYHKAMSDEGAVGLLPAGSRQGARSEPGADVRREPRRRCAPKRRRPPRRCARWRCRPGTNEKGRPAVGLLPEPSNKTVFDDIALAHREIYALYEIAQAMGTSLGVADTMALISSKLSNLVPFSCCALFLHNEELETLRCRFATGIDAEVDSADFREERPRPDGLGRAQPPHARQRAAERRPRSGRHLGARRRCSRRWSARWSSTSGSSARCRSTTSTRAATPTTIAGCSIASASRPPRSSTTRSSSSRRRKIRSPIR